MTGWHIPIEQAGAAFGRAIEPVLMGLGAASLIVIAIAAAIRWRARS